MLTIKKITKELKKISPFLEIVKCKDYCYFVYNDEYHFRNTFETHSIMIPRINDFSMEQWISEGKNFVAEIEEMYVPEVDLNQPIRIGT